MLHPPLMGKSPFLYWFTFNAMVLTNVSETIRLMFVHISHILMFAELLVISKRAYKTLGISGALLVAGMSAMILVGFLVRAIAHMVGLGAQDPLTASADQIAFLLLLIIGFIIGNYGFVQIRLEKLWLKNKQIGEQLLNAQTINHQLQHVLEARNDLLRSMSLAANAADGGIMLSSLAHELSQPLNSMRLNVDFLKKQLNKETGLGPARHALTDVISDTERLVEIVAKIRLLFQKDRHEFDRVNLAEVTATALRTLQPELDRYRVSADFSMDGELWVWGQRVQLQMVLSNLIKNAIDVLANQNGERRLKVTGHLEHSRAMVSVRDSGPGVPMQQRVTLFNLYATSKNSGLGVGLWICRMVAEHHKGTLTYADAPEGGAQFTLALPAH